MVIGSLGEIHPTITRDLDVPQRIYYAELNLHDLIQLCQRDHKMKELPLYPSSERDWTLTLKVDTNIQDVLKAIERSQSKILEDISLLDVYQSERLGKEKKNVTFHFIYRDRNKTLSQEEVDTEHSRLTQEALRFLGKEVI